jgi:uncharacterized protein YecE (DUF72 family)
MHGRSRLWIDEIRPMRHAMEIRHESFIDPAFVRLLKKYGIALVVADTAGKWPFREDVTADFVYIRLHGDKELYASGYGSAALRKWAGRIAAWRSGEQPEDARLIDPGTKIRKKARDIYCYFDNDVKVRAPFDAKELTRLVAAVEGPSATVRRRIGPHRPRHERERFLFLGGGEAGAAIRRDRD